MSAGRYFHYNIKPTGTYEGREEQPENTHQQIRAGKTLDGGSTPIKSSSSREDQSFLGRGDLRPLVSGSPIRPSPSSTVTSAMVTTATQIPPSPRQNGNPDIQDIITGIVKLLNGNVNVHANTQGVRRPSASRINNRGPPRISEAQNLPIDYEAQKPGTSMRPPLSVRPSGASFHHWSTHSRTDCARASRLREQSSSLVSKQATPPNRHQCGRESPAIAPVQATPSSSGTAHSPNARSFGKGEGCGEGTKPAGDAADWRRHHPADRHHLRLGVLQRRRKCPVHRGVRPGYGCQHRNWR